jgi:hypothetical protein
MSVPLNTEPSRPEERWNQHLELKSYKGAVEENPTKANNMPTKSCSTAYGINGVDERSGQNQGKLAERESEVSRSPAPLLGIGNKHGEGETMLESENSKETDEYQSPFLNGAAKNTTNPGTSNEGIEDLVSSPIQYQESRHEYSATVRGSISQIRLPPFVDTEILYLLKQKVRRYTNLHAGPR